DVMTLAHELGHGLHQYLSRPVGYLQCDTPLTTAEMASVFGEMLTFQRLLQTHPDPRTRLAMLCSKVEDGFATVFRQVVLTRFEQALHRARAEEGELTTERVNELWPGGNRPTHGAVVQVTDGCGAPRLRRQAHFRVRESPPGSRPAGALPFPPLADGPVCLGGAARGRGAAGAVCFRPPTAGPATPTPILTPLAGEGPGLRGC